MHRRSFEADPWSLPPRTQARRDVTADPSDRGGQDKSCRLIAPARANRACTRSKYSGRIRKAYRRGSRWRPRSGGASLTPSNCASRVCGHCGNAESFMPTGIEEMGGVWVPDRLRRSSATLAERKVLRLLGFVPGSRGFDPSPVTMATDRKRTLPCICRRVTHLAAPSAPIASITCRVMVGPSGTRLRPSAVRYLHRIPTPIAGSTGGGRRCRSRS